MTTQTYLEELRRALTPLPREEIEDIVRDQAEYIGEAVRAGRAEDEVLRKLGTPADFAAGLVAEARIQKAENSSSLGGQANHTVRALFAIVALAPLNLIFVLGPFLGAAGLLAGGWGVAAGVLATGVALVGAFFAKMIFVSVGVWVHVAAFFFAAGTVALGLLTLVLMAIVTRLFLRATMAYLRWNLSFVQSKSKESQ